MSDTRWFDIDADIDLAVTHLTRAGELFRTRDMNGDELDAYMARMAFMHAVMAGHTLLENALTRVLRLLGEEASIWRNLARGPYPARFASVWRPTADIGCGPVACRRSHAPLPPCRGAGLRQLRSRRSGAGGQCRRTACRTRPRRNRPATGRN